MFNVFNRLDDRIKALSLAQQVNKFENFSNFDDYEASFVWREE